MKRATLTADAKRELQEIWVLIALDNEPAEPDLGPFVRSWPVNRYMVYYRPIENGVEILHIYDGARDIPRLFR